MSNGQGGAHPESASGQFSALTPNPLNRAIRNFQQAHATALVAERSATHDLVEAHVLADVLAAILPMIEQGLSALNELEARRP